MHQQVRTFIRKGRRDGAGERVDEESLVDILTLLKGKNLQSAGRTHLDGGGGEFVFSVGHERGDDTAAEEVRDILRNADYEAEVFHVESFVLNHREGALLASIERLEAKLKEPVIEVHVLASEQKGKVPVQLVTRSMLNR